MANFSADLLVNEDGFGLYYSRVSDTLKSLDDISSFFKKLASAESSYSKELAKLSKTVDQKLWKRTDKEIGTVEHSWTTFHAELEKVGKFHEQLASKAEELVLTLDNWVKEKEKTKIKLNKDGAKLTKDTHDTMTSLKRAKENYYKLHKAADDAEAAYQKKKAEPAAKQKDVDKLSKKSVEAKEKAQNADVAYKKVLEKANEHQTNFYTTYMPKLLEEFQSFDEERTQFFRQVLEQYMTMLSALPPSLSTSCDALNKVVSEIDASSDVATFIANNRASAVTPPPEIQYEPYSGEGGVPSSLGSSPSATSSISRSAPPAHKPTPAGSMIHKPAATKQWGLSAADESLSNDQKKAKLEQQLKEVNEDIESEIKSKKGLDKLVKFYAADPVAQKKAVQEATDQEKKIDVLKEEKEKIVRQLEAVGGSGDVAPSEDASPEPANGDAEGGEFEEVEYVEVKARALFDYEATNETELSFKAGEILTVSEQDESGWWYADLNGKQGFVPNNYLTVVEEVAN
ncbi:SH3 domain containing protein [Acanthamoeba castellanii str. Neff]|uniref:SH3 domain containing protein n=1 Tax=Acanthamoeba castellanii (strain ATCC 30010 / Neff) TaxID=1257118 RepID=L8H6I9_ACACF|nr:SH3 domain containing protein [Acanthamoeba castellanii str. Neff]ELR20066.1 SH3 domain containing protein [Acanthamoeba castellanii str. Neff]